MRVLIVMLWRKLPREFRDRFHYFLHIINSNSLVLRAISFRHNRTVNLFSNSSKDLRIRLGESRFYEGWISTNYQLFCRHFLDATKPYGMCVAQYIFADNVIEHLNRSDGERLIRQAFSALVPGGVLRLATPDLQQIVNRYQDKNTSDLQDFAESVLGHGLEIRDFPDLLRVTFVEFGHHKGYIYDYEALSSVLENCGFERIRKVRPGESSISELVNLESRTGNSDMWSQMVIEATKPWN